MRFLIIGGTRFVGRHIAESALERGHEVTVFHRGQTGADALPDATHVLGDRDHDLDRLAEGTWDVTVDACAYVPRQVDELAEALGGRGGRHVFISTVSVYDEPMPPNSDEDAPLATLDDPDTEVVDEHTYGGLKVLCERAVHRHHSDALVIRPTYVVGPHDYTHRFTRTGDASLRPPCRTTASSSSTRATRLAGSASSSSAAIRGPSTP
jgi:2'-hydroxyisoflavone reductase